MKRYLLGLIVILSVSLIYWKSPEAINYENEENSPLFAESLNNSVSNMETVKTASNSSPQICQGTPPPEGRSCEITSFGATCDNTQCVDTSGCRPTCDGVT